MFLQNLRIEGYKGFAEPFTIEFAQGLSVLVGENGSGKTAIIDAIRLMLMQDEFGRTGVTETDFHLPFEAGAKRAESIRISGEFSDLSGEEVVAFLPWTDFATTAKLTLHVDNKETNRGYYRRALWGGASRASAFERELFERINCIYLPPLRDAEAKLREGRGSRLARLLRALEKGGLDGDDPHPLETAVTEFNQGLATNDDYVIARASGLIRQRLRDAMGQAFGQDAFIQFSESSFNRIVENLRLFFFPDVSESPLLGLFRSLDENSLGYNNLLYLATVLAELTTKTEDIKDRDYLKVLLIEEPEAHLHPQLQIRLLKYLEDTAKQDGIQVVVTTHSPVLASAVSLDTMIHVSVDSESVTQAISIRDCGVSAGSKTFISRWLDVTKSVLLFAKSVILVEGIAEGLLLPALAQRVLAGHNQGRNEAQKLPGSLADCGVAVINMNGIYFKHFMSLFCNLGSDEAKCIPVRCAGITDQDPVKSTKASDGKRVPFKPTPSSKMEGQNPALALIPRVMESQWARLYANELKTFEYDLAMEHGNLDVMLPVAMELLETEGSVKQTFEELQQTDWNQLEDEQARADAAHFLLSHIDKGEFAQALARRLQDGTESFCVPEYIRKAVLWACGGYDE